MKQMSEPQTSGQLLLRLMKQIQNHRPVDSSFSGLMKQMSEPQTSGQLLLRCQNHRPVDSSFSGLMRISQQLPTTHYRPVDSSSGLVKQTSETQTSAQLLLRSDDADVRTTDQ
ncbi:hypothetical protein WMY93_030653 [Mugilogobius chulae]|uniref:Uncharacterized protein n=1 Tax=Mugilogobius chulae TaxID=88201 RepID=A0AAW0MNF8_9GOBI